jgi:hypothetical protein
MKRLPRSLNQDERNALKAVVKAGEDGLTDAKSELVFRRRIPSHRRIQILRKLQGLGLIYPERSPGGGTLWKKRDPHESGAHDKRVKAPVDPSLLRVYRCERWPSLVLRNGARFVDGFLAADLETQEMIEGGAVHGFGTFIIRLEGAEAEQARSAAKMAAEARGGGTGARAVALHP